MWRTNWFETHKAETRLCHYGSLNAQQRNRHQRCLPRRELSVSMPMCDKSGLLSASNVCSTNVCSTNRRDYQWIQQTNRQTNNARSIGERRNVSEQVGGLHIPSQEKNKSGLNTGLCRSPPHFGEPQLQAASCMNPHTWTLKVCPLTISRLTGCTHGTWAHCSDISLSSSGS